MIIAAEGGSHAHQGYARRSHLHVLLARHLRRIAVLYGHSDGADPPRDHDRGGGGLCGENRRAIGGAPNFGIWQTLVRASPPSVLAHARQSGGFAVIDIKPVLA